MFQSSSISRVVTPASKTRSAGQRRDVPAPVAAVGLRREAVQQIAVLVRVKPRHAVHALKRRTSRRSVRRRRRHFREYGLRASIPPERARRVGHGRHVEARRHATGADDVRLDARVGHRLVVLAAHLRRQHDVAVVEQHLVGHGRGDPARGVDHQPANQLLPARGVPRVAGSQVHLPSPCPGTRQHRAAGRSSR